MAIWAKEVRNQFPGVDDGHPKLVNPLLKINLLCELLSAVAIFFLVRLSVQRCSRTTRSSLLPDLPLRHRASICGLCAASVAWLEPSMILDAHGWPQWDVWILPFYLFAALAALKNRWFICGCLLAAGAMFKGQLLFVTPFFVLWPLWQKRWNRALYVIAGFTATAAVIASPWLLRTPAAWLALAAVTCASSAFFLQRKLPHQGAWISGITGCAAFVIGVFAGGSFAWLQVGFLYGSEHYPYLVISSCYNLPSLLSQLGWSLKDPFCSIHFGSLDFHLTLQWTLRLLYLGALTVCAYGAARQVRDRDPGVLIAIGAPWLLMFSLLGQMHERYLVWGAVVSAVALGVSLRLSIIHFIISAASTAMIVHVMLIDKKLEATLWAIGLLKHIRPMRPFWFWLAWPFICGTHYGCRSSNVGRLARQKHLRSRWDRSPRKLDHSCASSFGCAQIHAYCRASRRNKRQPSMMKRTLGNQTSSSGCACGFPRSVSPMMTKRK